MAGPIHGLLECFQQGIVSTTGSAQSLFVNCFNFLNTNTGTLGVRLIAYNTGTNIAGFPAGPRGMGMYPPFSTNPAGTDAWACFGFLSASKPWYIHFQLAAGANLGAADNAGKPALVDNGASFSQGIAFSFAQMTNGGNPWNGTSGSLGTGSAGTDTKGTPVWINNSGSNVVAYYPRSNDPVRGGANGTNHENMIGVAVASNAAYRAHFVADYDNFLVATDTGADGSYDNFLLFGAYTPLSGFSNPSVDLPYFCLFSNVIPWANSTTFGPFGGGTVGGGVTYPQVSVSGTCTMMTERLAATTGLFQDPLSQPNKMYPVQRWDELPILLGAYEFNSTDMHVICGQLGQHFEFVREVYNIPTHDTSMNGQRAVIGAIATKAQKITIPWASGTVPGSGFSMGGIPF